MVSDIEEGSIHTQPVLSSLEGVPSPPDADSHAEWVIREMVQRLAPTRAVSLLRELLELPTLQKADAAARQARLSLPELAASTRAATLPPQVSVTRLETGDLMVEERDPDGVLLQSWVGPPESWDKTGHPGGS